MARSLSVHCHFLALILCCSARHKLSRPASPSTSTTSANPQIKSAFGGTKDRYILQNKMSALHLQIQIQQQHTKKGARFKSTRLRLLSTSCKALKADQVGHWWAMLARRNLSYLASHPGFYTPHSFRGCLSRISSQTAGRGQPCVRPHTQLPNSHARGTSR